MGLPTICETTSYGERVFVGVHRLGDLREDYKDAEVRLAAKVAEREAWWANASEAEKVDWKVDRHMAKLDEYEKFKGKTLNDLPPGYGGTSV